MIKIHKNTLADLEFPSVLEQISEFALTEPGRLAVSGIVPYKTASECQLNLHLTNEYLASFDNENRIPNHAFEIVTEELNMLAIENSVLDIDGFRKIALLVSLANDHIRFFKKFKSYYPNLFELTEEMEQDKVIVKAIGEVIDRHGQVRDKASDALSQIRKKISKLSTQLNSGFKSALSRYKDMELLDEILESVVENRRVLAVKSMYRRKVKGQILGSSKTGSIVFIEPESVLKTQRELHNLRYDEDQEIKRILGSLTDQIRYSVELLRTYQDFLIKIDLISAKAKYAKQMDACLPEVSDTHKLLLKEAYHPLLLLSNQKENLPTYPQTIEMDPDCRIIVISGPNAGGKSITLKTIGLLQLMFQSGILVPVHESSKMCFFNRILSDIGDNQSIENHLSTYSYRLKQMSKFLKLCDNNTLFLIDEFGTGSDPELGGALAEVFLEVFYERESYGVITTHYTNLKMLADEQPGMMNANMLFDEHSLQPTFQLIMGEPGSSFTFEVAQKTGIPYSLVNRARKKIEAGKVRFEKTIAKLQKQRHKMERTERSMRASEQKTMAQTDRLESINAKMQYKLERYQEMYDHNQKLIYLGQKIDQLAKKFAKDKRKRDLLNELFKIVQVENSKRQPAAKPKDKKEIAAEKKIKAEVQRKLSQIRKKKKKVAKAQAKMPKPKPELRVGDRVRLHDGRAVGSIDKIEKNKALVNYGKFTTNVDLDQLELAD